MKKTIIFLISILYPLWIIPFVVFLPFYKFGEFLFYRLSGEEKKADKIFKELNT